MKARVSPLTERIVRSFEELVYEKDSVNPPKINEIAICKDTGDRYIWDGYGWVPHKEEAVNTLNTGLSLYDINKQLVEKLPDYTDEDIENATSLIDEFVKELNSEFYMLLNKDINYYTIFNISDVISEPICSEEIMACVKELGTIKSVGRTEDEQAIEIWIKQDDNISVMYLFDYSGGVIQCKM